MKKLSDIEPYKQLDIVLACIWENTGESIPDSCLNVFQISDLLLRFRGISCSPREIDFIVMRLIKDGYITNDKSLLKGISVNGKKLSEIDEPFYFITFDGKVHITSGGYEGDFTSKNKEKARISSLEKVQNKVQCQMVILTSIIALGTLIAAIYYLKEIFK
jgi:hypothetical protein